MEPPILLETGALEAVIVVAPSGQKEESPIRCKILAGSREGVGNPPMRGKHGRPGQIVKYLGGRFDPIRCAE